MFSLIGKLTGPSVLVLALLILMLSLTNPSRPVVGEENFRLSVVFGILVAAGTALTVGALIHSSRVMRLVLGLILGGVIGLIGWGIAYGFLTFS